MEYTEDSSVLAAEQPKKLFPMKSLTVVVAFYIFFLALNYLPFATSINQGLALLLLVAILWMTEAVHIAVTALIIPVASICLGILDTKSAMNSFSHPIIYLFFGGFVLAAAIHVQGIDRYLAQRLVQFAKGRLKYAFIYMFLLTAALSMWISNIATTTIMLPLALGLLKQVDTKPDRNTYVFVLLGIAFSANIGGLGTLVGCASNMIAASIVGIDFVTWLMYGLPAVCMMMPIMIWCLYRALKPQLDIQFQVTKADIQPLSNHAKATLVIFMATALAWINSKALAVAFGGIAYFDSLIALIAAVVLIVTNMVRWCDVEKATDWGVLILFGGGLTLSQVMRQTGTSDFIGSHLATSLTQIPPLFFLILMITFVMFLTQFTSNTASATLLVPIFVTLAMAFDFSPEVIAVMVAMSTSFAFMLPVATPPNAIVYGTGYIKQSDMLRAGALINFAGLMVLIFLGQLFM
jgi:sodium-dependent dicarboxylate transporter 2/3/5